jgi:hypothetical protein
MDAAVGFRVARRGCGAAAGMVRGLVLTVACLPAAAQSLADVPGVVVRSLPTPPIGSFFGTPVSGSPKVYTASPSIAVLPNGDYVITDNDFGSESTAATSARTNVFRSTDKGATWTQTATLTEMKRGSLFVHQGTLHLIGYTTNNAKKDALSVIRRSTDNGVAWGVQPSTRDTGLFGNGGGGTPNVPVVHDGRLWLALGGKRARSVPTTETNLLLTRRWTRSGQASTSGGPVASGITISEAQVVASPRTGVVLMPKVQQSNTSVLLRVDPADPSKMLTPTAADWIALPGGEKKFAARYDPVSDRFWVLSNPVLPAHADHLSLSDGTFAVRPWLVRNTAALISSRDLVSWDVEQIFLYSKNVDYEGFQYPQFDYDGADMVIASRTAFDVGGNKPLRGHDSNLTTFHRIEDFRTARARHVVEISGGGVLRSELTQHDAAPLGSFTQGTVFAGAALTAPTGLGQAADGDVYIAEQGGRVLRFDGLGNFREVVAAAPVALAAGTLELPPAAAGERTWTRSDGGNWADLDNWHYWNRPDTNAEIVTLGSAITTAATLSLDRGYTMKGIRFRSDASYTLAGPGGLLFDADTGRGLLHAERGSHVVSLDISLADDLDLVVEESSVLRLEGGLALGGKTLRVSGAGNLVFAGGLSGAGSLVISGGATVRFLEEATVAHSGPTSVLGGVLLVDGVFPGSGGVTLGAGGTLAGSGTIGGSLVFAAGSTLSPGPGEAGSGAGLAASIVPEPGLAGPALLAVAAAWRSWRRRRTGGPRHGFVVR